MLLDLPLDNVDCQVVFALLERLANTQDNAQSVVDGSNCLLRDLSIRLIE